MASSQFLSFTRKLSSAVAGKAVKTPVQVFGLEGRYASALYSAAVKLQQLEAVEKDLNNIKKLITDDVKLRDFIYNPTIKKSLKMDAMKQVSTKAGLTAPATNLLDLLAENGRLGKLDQIVNSFSTIMAGHRGEIKCEVTTAKALDEDTKTQLQSVLKSFAKKGENIVVELKVDPNIIGGMVVSIGDHYVDMSVSSKIKKYTDLISQSV